MSARQLNRVVRLQRNAYYVTVRVRPAAIRHVDVIRCDCYVDVSVVGDRNQGKRHMVSGGRERGGD